MGCAGSRGTAAFAAEQPFPSQALNAIRENRKSQVYDIKTKHVQSLEAERGARLGLFGAGLLSAGTHCSKTQRAVQFKSFFGVILCICGEFQFWSSTDCC